MDGETKKEMLKEKFTKKLVLSALDFKEKMRIEVDVSDYAIEGVLSMEYEDGKWGPVVYLSKSLNGQRGTIRFIIIRYW